ncbi:unnamed protein product [Lampetra planeri]
MLGGDGMLAASGHSPTAHLATQREAKLPTGPCQLCKRYPNHNAPDMRRRVGQNRTWITGVAGGERGSATTPRSCPPPPPLIADEMLTTSPDIQEVVGSRPTLTPVVYLECACLSPRGRVDFSRGPPVFPSTFRIIMRLDYLAAINFHNDKPLRFAINSGQVAAKKSYRAQ